MKIVLIQVWMGKIPDYFWYHYETTKSLPIDFLFFTNQEINLDAKNYKVIKLEFEELNNLVIKKTNEPIKIKSLKKVCDLKASYGDLFSEYIKDYDYFGCYDIDTFIGDVNKFVIPHIGKYDYISVADEKFYNRLSGPFILMKNTEEIRTFYKSKEFTECFNTDYVQCFEEMNYSSLVLNKFDVKLIYSINVETNNGGKLNFESIWSGGKVFDNVGEKLIYHFFNKNDTLISKINNVITAQYKKELIDDFVWVVHFSENYERLIPYLIDSIKKYSNRRCVLYTINYSSQLSYKIPYNSEQFIFRRIEIEEGKKDLFGRDSSIMNSKPLILLDAIKNFPNKKFVHIDTDVYLTVNADSITKFFDKITKYPLINSHIHDTVWLKNIVPNEEWSSPIHILLNAMEIKNEPVRPRKKCNVIVFDERCSWFFEEQMEVYNKFKDSGIPGIFSIFDEDTANALLTKYEFQESLPVIDIEDSHEIDIEKFRNINHPFHMTNISPAAIIPNHENDVLLFHNFKSEDDYLQIMKEYGVGVLECDDIIITYENDRLSYRINSFLTHKKINEKVDFILKDLDGRVVAFLGDQEIWNYWVFYITNIFLEKNTYLVEIVKTNSKIKIYNNTIKII